MRYYQFAILGLSAGGAYALLALGVTAIHRGTGILNFAQGVMATFCAYWFYELRTHGWPIGLASAGAIVIGGVLGAVIDIVVMRPLRSVPVLAKIVGTIGVVVVIESVLLLVFGSAPQIPTAVLPNRVVEFTGVRVSLDRLLLAGIAVAVGLVLSVWARYAR